MALRNAVDAQFDPEATPDALRSSIVTLDAENAKRASYLSNEERALFAEKPDEHTHKKVRINAHGDGEGQLGARVGIKFTGKRIASFLEREKLVAKNTDYEGRMTICLAACNTANADGNNETEVPGGYVSEASAMGALHQALEAQGTTGVYITGYSRKVFFNHPEGKYWIKKVGRAGPGEGRHKFRLLTKARQAAANETEISLNTSRNAA